MKEGNIIWATLRSWQKDDASVSGKPVAYEVFKLSVFGREYIKNLSAEIKTIIAYYSKLYITEESADLASALGDFSALKDAQDALLEDKEQYFKDVKKQDFLHGIFEIETEENLVYAKLSAMTGSYKGTEVFRIHENGVIEYLSTPPQPDPQRRAIKMLLR